jgi:hypothetical protein
MHTASYEVDELLDMWTNLDRESFWTLAEEGRTIGPDEDPQIDTYPLRKS